MCFSMFREKIQFDMLTNSNVRNGFISLMELLDSMDSKFGTYVWDARYKGLDDYVWGQLNTMRNRSEMRFL